MGDREVFDFLKEIGPGKEFFLDKGWVLKYWYENNDRGRRWWPESFKDIPDDIEDTYAVPFPPGFKLVGEGFDYDKGIVPEKCCTHCAHSKNQYTREYSFGCRNVEVIAGQARLEPPDTICPGHSNPVFPWKVEFAPHAYCDYFVASGLNYNI